MNCLCLIKAHFFSSISQLRSLIATSVAFFLAAILSYLFVDLPVIEKIAPYRNFLSPLLKALSLAIFPPLYLALSIGGFFYSRFISKQKRWSLSFFEIGVAQFFSMACVRIFKVIFGRIRPENYFSKNLTGFDFFNLSDSYHSFPSGHTMAAFTLAASLFLLFRRLRSLSLSLAFILSFGRVFSLNHFPSDLFATASLGILIAKMVHIMLNKVLGKNFTRDSYERIATARN